MFAVSRLYHRVTAAFLITVLTLFLGLAVFRQPAATLAQDEAGNVATVEAVIQAVLDADQEAFEAAYAEDYVGHLAQSSERGDLSRIDLTEIAMFLAQSFTDLEIETEQLFGDGELVASRSIIRGIFTQEFFDYPPTEAPVEIEVVAIHRFNDDGLIVEEWISYDNYSIMQQLGVLTTD